MAAEQDNGVILARLDEYNRIVTLHGERINMTEARVNGLTLVVMGDSEKKIPGLLQRTVENEETIERLELWRHDMLLFTKVIAALLSVLALGQWLPFIQTLLKVMGG